MTTVAFIGLGTMGSGMVRNLLRADFAVRGWNRTAARAEPLMAEGMVPAASPAEAAEGADVAVTCVSNDAALEDVALGDRGVLAGLARGAVLVDCGTTSLELTRRLDERARAQGVAFLDAPITGSKLGAEGGKLTLMVGGAAADLARVRPLFEAVGKHTVHVGAAVGQGQAAKLCLNMTQAVMLEGVLEGYVLARTLGVPLPKMAEILDNSAGRSGVGAFKTPYLFRGDFEPHFRLDLMHKDLHLALGEAAARRVPLPLSRNVLTLYDQGVAEGLGDRDFLVLARLLERWARTDLREPEPSA